MTEVVDLFAGPGGWDVAAHRIGLDPLGIEWDDAACATRKAAGFRTLQADVAELDPLDYKPWGLIASPPCQAWSMAGKGGGRRDKDHVVRCAGEIAAGVDTRTEHAEQCEDPRSILVVEPLRWALSTKPQWIAMEQVPPVIELWSMFAQILSLNGYSTWTGVLEAERYGVPQTRERAILIARLGEQVHPPVATHQRYVKGQPQRHDITLEGEVLPWVSMAQALGWDEGTAAYKLARGEGMEERYGERRAVPDARTASWQPPTHLDVRQTGARPRPVGEPAPTMLSEGLAKGVPVWRDGRSEEFQRGDIPATEPAPTVGSTTRLTEWVHDRPAPTVVTTRRSKDGLLVGRQLPAGEGENVGGHGWENGPKGDGSAVRVTVEQAAALQTFPAGYPWQGSRTKKFEQIGNAVPPLLAEHVLRAVVPVIDALEKAA